MTRRGTPWGAPPSPGAFPICDKMATLQFSISSLEMEGRSFLSLLRFHDLDPESGNSQRLPRIFLYPLSSNGNFELARNRACALVLVLRGLFHLKRTSIEYAFENKVVVVANLPCVCKLGPATLARHRFVNVVL